MDLNNFFQSKTFKKILCGIGAVVVFLFVLQAGMFIGYKKASFSYLLGDNYHNTFGPRGGSMMGFPRGGFSGAHGVIGKIVKADSGTLVIEGQDKIEKIVLIKENTVIMSLRNAIKPTDLKVDDFIVVMGSPDDKGQIEAKLIRIMPQAPETFNEFRR